ncbi:MAG: MFS transporter, partial [Clostridia bacterium]|nr:MFS transporter [Clostridia bacterium]
MQPNYRKTITACYLGIITQAISANFAPLLFLTFRSEFSLSLEQVALIPTLFYFTQLLVDLASAKFVDRIGYRPCILASEIFSVIGVVGLAFLPGLFAHPFAGVLICVVLYAVGSGLIEVLVSPIVEACPSENKAAAMSLMHSFYCWGVVAVILGSTLFFNLFGIGNWRILACLWALVPLVNIYNFAVCPIEHPVEDGKGMSIGQLLRMPLFWLLCLLMVCAGSAELSMAQWASAFTESALGVSKTVGDLAGPCLFAVLMGAARVLYSRMSAKADLTRFMLFSGALCVLCYLLAALASL